MVIKKKVKKLTPKPKFAGDVLPNNGVMSAKAEAMLMGFTIALDSIDEKINRTEVVWYVSYILSVLNQNTPADNVEEAGRVYEGMTRYGKNIAKHITVNTIDGMVMIALTLDDGEDEFPVLDTEYGVFSYVYNITVPDFSELGYTFYEKRANTYHRIG